MRLTNNTLWAVTALILATVYQVHCAIHGFDLTDEGYLMSLYHWFGTDIDCAQGAGGYPLTCYLGWWLDNQWPEGGILGMRLWGVLVVTLTGVMAYLYLKRFFHPKMVIVGLLIQTWFVAGDPKPFGYNTLTAFLGIGAMIMICEGTIRKRFLMLAAGGLLLGVNVFVRLPNLACGAFMVLPFLLHPQLTLRGQWREPLVQALTVAVAFIVAVAGMWQLLGLWGADKLTVELIRSIPETLNGESTHGSSSLLSKYAVNYIRSGWQFMVFMLMTVMAGWCFKRKIWSLRLLVLALATFLLYQDIYMMGNMLGNNLLAMMNGLGLFGALCYYNRGAAARLVAAGAVLMSLVFPLGSDGGYQTMWVGTWLLLPVGLSGIYTFISDAIKGRKCLQLRFGAAEGDGQGMTVTARALRGGFLFCLTVLLVTVLVKIEHKSYYDPGNRYEKVWPVHGDKARGIYTSRERAAIVNPMLKALEGYVAEGDTLLVYDSSPLLYYLTGTKPFAGVSWPCVFYGQQYVRKFVAAENSAASWPVMVVQFFYSSNEWSEVERDYYMPETGEAFSDLDMKRNIRRFMSEHHYRTVWSNGYYKIMIPGNYRPRN